MLADDVRANPDEPDRAEDGRLMYYEHQVQRSDRYVGLLSDWPVERVRLIFPELIRYTNIDNCYDMPLPPAGLPGFLRAKYDRDELAAEIILIGLRYLVAVVRNEGRAMHNRWREARDFLRKLEKETEEAVIDRIAAEEAVRIGVKPTRQFVYFIGAAFGPIKIGVAVNPQNRLKGIQTSHHEKLSILAVCDGDQDLERSYHKRFADRRLNGEWFERCPEIEAEIARLTPPPPHSAAKGLAG